MVEDRVQKFNSQVACMLLFKATRVITGCSLSDQHILSPITNPKYETDFVRFKKNSEIQNTSLGSFEF